MLARLVLLLSIAAVAACARPSTIPSTYGADGYWHRYREALPPEARVPHPDTLREERIRVASFDVHLDRLPAHDSARGTVILVHGGGGNGRLLMSFARPIAAAGWDIVAPDLPGFGLTAPLDGAGVHVNDWVTVVRELARIIRAETSRPVFLVGMSVGSLVAYNAAATGAPVDGIAVTMLPDPADRRVRRAMAGGWWTANVLAPMGRWTAWVSDAMRVRLRQVVALDVMTPDTTVVRLLREDPLIGGRAVRMGLLRSFLGIRLAVPPEDFTTVPLLLVHPGEDRWTPLALSRPTFERVCGPKRLVVLEGAPHLPVTPPGAWATLQDALREFLVDPNGATARGCGESLRG
jgi:alpha-beta hydrolase superfamily lysophospholipase